MFNWVDDRTCYHGVNYKPLHTEWTCLQWNLNPKENQFELYLDGKKEEFYFMGKDSQWKPTNNRQLIKRCHDLPERLDWIGFGIQKLWDHPKGNIELWIKDIEISNLNIDCGDKPGTFGGPSPAVPAVSSKILLKCYQKTQKDSKVVKKCF